MFKNGEILYCNKFKTTPERGMAEIALQRGNLITLLLGQVPEDHPAPDAKIIQCLVGGIGYVKFDDVLECLGKDACDKLLVHFREKYFAKTEILHA